ncbi:kinase-like protein [Polyplosphaeria fusca]|uniref:Kinase-like protein n=1 Tax=Polyplosphaeria fusca TaxID=682080 RepID=A0A9P4V304_9PLEO|nr:kinase-like protein [Polyplosphaeria fusca]
MSRIPDLVLDSKLVTEFRHGLTKHVLYEADPSSTHRTTKRKESWKPEKCIGRGGFGSVWLERCVRGKRDVELRAVKNIPRPAEAKDYLRELESIAKFSHPRYARCFVKSLGWYETSDDLYIAMEYLAFGDLHHYLADNIALTEAEIKEIAYQICEGLSLMHENGFAHRDLKPGNILICSQPPQPWWVKIADFGISKRVENATTGPSTRKGTETFMPPEWHGFSSNEDDAASEAMFAVDMWSLGEVTYRMFTRHATFKSSYEVYKFTEGQMPFPRDPLRRSNASDTACNFIEELMKPAAELRPTASRALQHEWMPILTPNSPDTASLKSFEYEK